jgi:hypothetical protein
MKFEHTVNEGDEFVVNGFFRGVVEVDPNNAIEKMQML